MTAATANSSVDWLRRLSIVLAVLGAVDALYLTYVKLAHAQAAFCQAGGGCDTVNASPYSEIGGIPVALLGFGAFLLILLLLLLERRMTEYGPLAVFGLSMTGVLYSGYLTYLELFVIHAICPYCVISAVLLLALLGISILRLQRLG